MLFVPSQIINRRLAWIHKRSEMIRTCRFVCLNNDMSERSLLLIFLAQGDDKDLPSTCSKNETIEEVVPKGENPKRQEA